MSFIDVFGKINPIPGWMGKGDCEVLYKYGSQSKGLIVEIGSHLGRSAALLALSNPDVEVVTIDVTNYPELQENAKRFNFTQITGESRVVGESWSRGPIDLLFVDGDHSFEGVWYDIRTFVSKMGPRGLMLFHDYYDDDMDRPGYRVTETIRASKLVKVVSVESGIAICERA